MTLRVFHGPRLGPLADELVAALAEPLADPFTPEVVAVPTAGVRDWLRRHLARRRGVTANVAFPFPNRFTSMALGLDPGHADADDPWSVARITWAVVDVLGHGGVSVPGWSAATPSARPRQYVVARHIADLFDQYATNRPDVLAQWAAGVPGDGTVSGDRELVGPLDASMAWQFELFRAVRERIGEAHPAEQRQQRLADLRAGRLEPAVPARTAFFGTSALSATQLDVLDALGTVRDVEVFVVSPSPSSWERSPPLDPRRLVARRRDADDDDALGGHPLVRSWGRSALETASLVRGLADAVVVGPGADDAGAPATLLRHLQRDIVEDRPPTPFAGAADATVQVHACHGALRQLDALRDALDSCFVADPTLEPRDVLVMSPDVGRFAPFAPAVLGRGRLPVPVTVSDLTLGAENPVATAFRAVVAALAGRCTAVDVLDLATLAPVRRMFSLTPADLERFGRWVDELGTSWGLDARQRDEWLDAHVAEGTWAAGIDRLLLGAAVPAPPGDLAAAYPGGVQPFDDIAADDMRSAGRLAELVGRLRGARSLLAGRHRIDEWTQRLTAVLSATCSVPPDEAWQLASVAGAIDGLGEQATIGGTVTDVALDVREVAAVLDDALGTARGRLRTRSGDVLLTGLVPLRNVPARVVCLLGADADSMRPATVDGDDLLARRPCVGERDRRAELRHGLLDALMAASDRVIITCDGVDVATNRPVRPSVALAELLDVVRATVGDDAIVVHHRRRAYDEQLFVTDAPTPSYDDAMLAAAATRRTAVVTPTWASRFDAPLPLLVPAEVDLEQLATACTRPARVLLRDRLDVRVPDDFDRGDVNIALGLPPLRGAELGRDLLARLLEGDGVDRDAIVARWRSDAVASGRLAPRRLGEQSLAAFEAQVLAMLTGDGPGTPGRDEVLAAARRVPIDLEIVVDEPAALVDDTVRTVEQVPSLFDTARVAVRLRDEVAGIVGTTMHRLAFSRPHNRYLVRTALDLAALVLTEPDVPWDAVLVTRAANGPKTLAQRFAASGPGPARTLLEVALELRLDALRRRLPLFERASDEAVHNWRPIDEMLLDDEDGAAPAHGDLGDAYAAFVWQQLSPAELDGLPIAPGELAVDLWRAVDGFLAAVRSPQPAS